MDRERPKKPFVIRSKGKTFEQVKQDVEETPLLDSFTGKETLRMFWQSQFHHSFPEENPNPWYGKEIAVAWDAVKKMREMRIDPAAAIILIFREWGDFAYFAGERGVRIKGSDIPVPAMLALPGMLMAIGKFVKDRSVHTSAKSGRKPGRMTAEEIVAAMEKESK